MLAYILKPYMSKILPQLEKKLNNRENKKVTTDISAKLADAILKKNYFRFLDKTFKQKRGTAIETKPTPSKSI